MLMPAAAAARSSGSNWRGGGTGWRRSSAQDGKWRSVNSATAGRVHGSQGRASVRQAASCARGAESQREQASQPASWRRGRPASVTTGQRGLAGRGLAARPQERLPEPRCAPSRCPSPTHQCSWPEASSPPPSGWPPAPAPRQAGRGVGTQAGEWAGTNRRVKPSGQPAAAGPLREPPPHCHHHTAHSDCATNTTTATTTTDTDTAVTWCTLAPHLVHPHIQRVVRLCVDLKLDLGAGQLRREGAATQGREEGGNRVTRRGGGSQEVGGRREVGAGAGAGRRLVAAAEGVESGGVAAGRRRGAPHLQRAPVCPLLAQDLCQLVQGAQVDLGQAGVQAGRGSRRQRRW